jgi:hypothetical protein
VPSLGLTPAPRIAGSPRSRHSDVQHTPAVDHRLFTAHPVCRQLERLCLPPHCGFEANYRAFSQLSEMRLSRELTV